MQVHAEKSTTGRTGHGPPRALRAGLGAVEAVAPRLAVRLAHRLFMTPPRHAAPRWEREALAGASPFELRAAGTTVRGWRLGEGPAVMLVHGWGGRGGQLATFAPPLLEAGCSVVTFDGPGHGASGGRTANVVRFAEAAAVVAHRHRARAAIGHSMGGAALAWALRGGLSLHAAVLVAPPRTPEGFLAPFCDALGLRPGTRDELRGFIERRVGVRMDDLDVPGFAPGLRTPALLVHDRADREVPFEDGAAIAAAWPGARLVPTERLGHRRILREPAVVSEVTSFVLDRIPRCACGRFAARVADGAPRCHTCLLDLHLAHREDRRPGPRAEEEGRRRPGFDDAVDAVLRSIENDVLSPGPAR